MAVGPIALAYFSPGGSSSKSLRAVAAPSTDQSDRCVGYHCGRRDGMALYHPISSRASGVWMTLSFIVLAADTDVVRKVVEKKQPDEVNSK